MGFNTLWQNHTLEYYLVTKKNSTALYVMMKKSFPK
jgi:hypothetical protein